MRNGAFLFFCLSLMQALSLACPAVAQQSEVGKFEISLPGSTQSSSAVVLRRKNLTEFIGILIEPLAEWLAEERFVVRVVSQLDFSWRTSPSWEEQSLRNASCYSLDQLGNLLTLREEIPAAGIPFPELRETGEKVQATTITARQILWNAAYAEAEAGEMHYSFAMAWHGRTSKLRSATGQIYRRWFLRPSLEVGKQVKAEAVVVGDTAQQKAGGAEAQVAPIFSKSGDALMQEVFLLEAPAAVLGFSQITWRMRGEEDDRFWQYSPVIGKSREVFAANRAERLFDGPLTAEDLFVFSGKIQAWEANLLGEKELLVIFPAVSPYLMQLPEVAPMAKVESAVTLAEQLVQSLPPAAQHLGVQGYQPGVEGSSSMVRWNYETRQFPTFAPWLPTTAFAVPRKVWIIELIGLNPLSRSARSYLFIDQESRLPVYSLVYNQRGELDRVVVGAWGLARDKSGEKSAPFLAFLLVVSGNGNFATTYNTTQLSLFYGAKTPDAVRLREMLNIRRHDKSLEEQTPAGQVELQSKRPLRDQSVLEEADVSETSDDNKDLDIPRPILP